jgi:hypothetical protein
MNAGSTLNLGADMNLSSNFIADAQNLTLNMNGHALSASGINLGYNSGFAPSIANRGALTAATLLVGNATFDLNATDSVTSFLLNKATSTLHSNVSSLDLANGSVATTTASGSVTGSVDILTGSTLHLGANLNLGNGSLNVQDAGSMVDAHHFGITASSLRLGSLGTAPVTLINAGTVHLDTLSMGNGSTMTLHGGDVITSQISLTGNSVLTVQQTNGMGLTFNGASASSLSIDPSHLDLIFNLNSDLNWVFRWQDPSGGGNWISTIDGMISSGQILVTAPQGYSVVDTSGYTEVIGGFAAAVPEPSSLVLAGIACVGVVFGTKWRQRRMGR